MKKNLPDCCSNACEKPALTEKIAVAEKIMAEQNAALAKAHEALLDAYPLILRSASPNTIQLVRRAMANIVGDKVL
jgi:hypothetical protein